MNHFLVCKRLKMITVNSPSTHLSLALVFRFSTNVHNANFESEMEVKNCDLDDDVFGELH